MRRLVLGLAGSVLVAAAFACGPLVDDSGHPGGGDGGTSNPTDGSPSPGNDSAAPPAGQDSSSPPAKDAAGGDSGSSGGDAGAGLDASDSGSQVDSSVPSCTPSTAPWSATAGISKTGWVATASSTSTTPGDTVTGAFDGNATTRWSSGQAQTSADWFRLDLGQAIAISQVSLYLLSSNVNDYPSAYQIQLSTDDVTYSTVATGHGGVTTAGCFAQQTARYVKVLQTGTSASWWSIYEITVFP